MSFWDCCLLIFLCCAYSFSFFMYLPINVLTLSFSLSLLSFSFSLTTSLSLHLRCTMKTWRQWWRPALQPLCCTVSDHSLKDTHRYSMTRTPCTLSLRVCFLPALSSHTENSVVQSQRSSSSLPENLTSLPLLQHLRSLSRSCRKQSIISAKISDDINVFDSARAVLCQRIEPLDRAKLKYILVLKGLAWGCAY